ncbi:MAG: hypothetical protein ACYTKC_19965 [Planctomycetota bacterium]|jgi:hypothetical protein
MSLPIPEEGQTVRISKGPLNLVLHKQRGALCLLTHEGEHEKRHLLGLPKSGHLELHARAPEHRIRVHVTDTMTLAPGGRIRGYVAVALPHRLVWRRPNGKAEPLLEVLPRDLKTSWLGEGTGGGYIHETESAFHLQRNEVRADIFAMVPVLLLNACEHTLSPVELTVSLRDRDLREVGDAIVASPRRLAFGDHDQVQETIRPLPRQSA